MSERMSTESPELSEPIHSEWNYGRDVRFVCNAVERHEIAGRRLLEPGCGTGEHTRRFLDPGFDVTRVDRYDGMLGVAREKCHADFRRMTVPAVTDDGPFDVIVALRGLVNNLVPDDLEATLANLESQLAEDGVLVFDNAPRPVQWNQAAVDVGSPERGRYARVVQTSPTEGPRLQ